MRRSDLSTALASAVAFALTGCSSTFPPVFAAPGPAEARGIKVLLYRDEALHSGDETALGHGLAQSLRAAGFEVIELTREGGHHGSSGPEPYDFALAYGSRYGRPDGTGYTTLRIGLRLAARELGDRDVGGVNWPGSSWAARNGAAAKGSSQVDDELSGELKACVDSWRGAAVGMDNAKVGALAYGGQDGVGVFGPSESDEAPDTRARAATFLVNQLVGCPGFVSFLHTVRASGLAADAPMQDLPLGALKNLCQASVGPRGDSIIGPTGSFKKLDDACTLALSKDRTLASFVQEVRNERKENLHESLQAERESAARGPSRDDDAPARGSSGAAAPGGGSGGIGAGLDAAGREIKAGIEQIEQQKREDAELRKKIEACTKAREQGRPCN